MFGFGAKALSALLLFVMAMAGGMAPLYVQRINPRLSSSMNSAAAGVFFASAMVHMLPEASAALTEAWGRKGAAKAARNDGQDDIGAEATVVEVKEARTKGRARGSAAAVEVDEEQSTPWGGLLCSIGFLMILCLDYGVVYMRAPVGEGDSGVSRAASKTRVNDGYNSQDGDEEEEDGVLEVDRLLSRQEQLSPQRRPSLSSSSATAASSLSLSSSLMQPTSLPALSFSASSSRDRSPHTHADGKHKLSRGRNAHALVNGSGSSHKHGGHGHGHSHGFGGSSAEEEGWLTTSALLLALSFHATMEGLGVGAGNGRMWGIVAAILVHKGLAAYALTSAMLSSSGDPGERPPPSKRRRVMVCLTAFSCMTPIGIWIGSIIGGNGEGAASAVCVALAAGTFLYVSLMEVLPNELNSPKDGFLKLAALLGGFTVTTVVSFFVE